MKFRRFCAAVLTTALLCGLCLPASGASSSSFVDVTNDTTAVNADVLRLMGVVSGVGDNRFMPDSNLSRAEFCVMVTNFIQRGEEVSPYAARTIFRDVTGKHWARGYINLMASPIGTEPAMISGIGDGSFAPDQKVTVAQAITVLLRVLGYTGSDTGYLWPESYMACAKSIGLLDGVSENANTVITRAQAAQLFVNALNCPVKSGQAYYATLGTVNENTIILAVNTTADDGTSGAIRTSLKGESFLPASGSCTPYALQGKRGALVLNAKGKIVTFSPDDSNSVRVTLSGNAQPSYLTGTNGTRYTVSSSTMLYSSASTQGKAYIESYTSLRPGTQVTLFTQSGKITAIYASGSADSGLGAVIASKTVKAADFYHLTAGVSDYIISKNGQTIKLKDIMPYDVVTYDPVSNTLVVSDLRITGTYTDASPNPRVPQTITALGTQFDVLSCAWDNMDNVKVGDTVTFLLTANGKVAGIKKSGYDVRANAVGLSRDNGVDIFLPNGEIIALSGTHSTINSTTGQVVSVTGGNANGRIYTATLPIKSPDGDFNISEMTLGDKKVSCGVRIFDQSRNSRMVQIDINSLSDAAISSTKIKTFRTDTSGYVDYIILDNYTGNAYTYGLSSLKKDDEGYRYLTLENGLNSGINNVQTALAVQDNQFSGVAVGGDGKIKDFIALKRIKNVSPTDFYEYQGCTYLNISGRNYLVSDDVTCYKSINKLWFTNKTGTERLAACKAFSDKLSAYFDPISEQIRVVVAE